MIDYKVSRNIRVKTQFCVFFALLLTNFAKVTIIIKKMSGKMSFAAYYCCPACG